jgi:hypothetical protein
MIHSSNPTTLNGQITKITKICFQTDINGSDFRKMVESYGIVYGI